MSETFPADLVHAHRFGPVGGRPVVFLHGFLGNGGDWRKIAAEWSDCRGLAPDLPGHGQTPVDGVPELNAVSWCADLVAQWLARETSIPPILVGYSMGGRIACEIARRRLTPLAGLILESVNPGLEEMADRHQRAHQDLALADKLRRVGTEAFLRDWYQLPLFGSLAARPELLEQVICERAGGDAEALARALSVFSVGAQESAWPMLENPPCPTLFLAGELDEKYCGIAAEVAKRCPFVQVTRVPQAGHNIHLEQPTAFAEQLLAF